MLLQIQNLHFAYSESQPLFRNLSLGIDEGSIVALAGESGCGKSTLLSIIYGLLDWQQGSLTFDGRKLLGPTGNIVPGEPEMKMVAQDYNLMPYSTVYDNVGQYLSNINLNEKRRQVMELLEVTGLQEFADVKPKFLSGGQKQRVAIARALSVMPKLLLLDEPFSNLDFSRKTDLRGKLFSYVKEKGISVIISTHELQEVMPWLDRIVVLQQGRLIQNDSPQDTYLDPYNGYVARLFGEVNELSAEDQAAMATQRRFCYPTDLRISESGHSATVLESRFAGAYYWTKLHCNGREWIMYSDTQLQGEVRISVK